jgi:hypothetical protein
MDFNSLQLGIIVLLAIAVGVLAASRIPVVSGQRCWPALRQVLGWLCMVIGILGLILPGPGLLLMGTGAALIGRRNPQLHRIAVLIKLRLRSWARQPGLRGWLGKRGQQVLRQQRKYMRQAGIWLGKRGRHSPAKRPGASWADTNGESEMGAIGG